MKTRNFALLLSFVISLPVAAQIKSIPMKPGLWEVSMKVKSGGSEIDPQAQLKEAMSKMSPEQRKQMKATLAKSGLSIGDMGEGGSKVCYNQELLSHGQILSQDPRRQCESTVKEQTSARMKMDFKCKDGSTGSGEWNFQSSKSYDGKMKFSSKDGKASEITQKGRFISADCGDVKPLTIPKG